MRQSPPLVDRFRLVLCRTLGAAAFVALVSGCSAEPEGDAQPTADLAPLSQPTPVASVPAGDRFERVSGYVGGHMCGECHAEQAQRWRGSHHDLAMQVADDSTVLGDFDAEPFEHFGVTSTFSKVGNEFRIRTQGPDGTLVEYPIRYTFGVHPLQQYLVEFPRGRLQALPLSWDARPAADGGQRWFHIYPDEAIPAGDALHWTGPNQNWNHMCAECHSTNLRKGYRAEGDRFETTWSEMNVSCEACHGPGQRHVAWAQGTPEPGGDPALSIRFESPAAASWPTHAATGLPERVPAAGPSLEAEVCGRCHARRSPLREDDRPGSPLADGHRIALLSEGLYYPDGQIQEEVYVYGSFVQSRMFAAGVACSDCHDPHSGGLRAEGNALCGQCHDAARFDVESHHHHPPESSGAECVACHMPTRTYMVVDDRRDHSLRVPRPDLSPALGSPNACTSCHRARSDDWAAEAISAWTGGGEPAAHWGPAIQAGRVGGREAERLLLEAAANPAFPDIARATAVSLLPAYVTPAMLPVLQAAIADPSPLVRGAAVMVLDAVEPRARLGLALPLLDDPVGSVRLEAARVLAAVPPELFDEASRARLDAALSEYEAAQEMDGDRAGAQLRLGTLYLQQGRVLDAEARLERALALDPSFVPAYVNLADLYRVVDRDADGEKVLRDALERAPESAEIHYALGLLLVRRKHSEAAIVELEQAAALEPDVSRFAYVLAVALHSTGDVDRARQVLREAAARHPGDPEIRTFLSQLEDAPAG